MAEEAREKAALVDEYLYKMRVEDAIVEEETDKLEDLERKIALLRTRTRRKKEEARDALLAGDPLVDVASGALELISRQELGDLAVQLTPPEGVDDLFAAIIALLAGKHPHIVVQKSGRVKEKDKSWDSIRKTLLANINLFIEELKRFKSYLMEGSVPKINLREVRPYLLLEHFKPGTTNCRLLACKRTSCTLSPFLITILYIEVMERRNEVAGALVAWVVNMVQYSDLLESIEPLRDELQQIEKEALVLIEQSSQLKNNISVLSAKKERVQELLREAAQTSENASRLAENTEFKLELAKKLLETLTDERKEWPVLIDSLQRDRSSLVRSNRKYSIQSALKSIILLLL